MSFKAHVAKNKTPEYKVLTSCALGQIIPLEKLSNDVFSSLILGEGFGVIPSENCFFAPCRAVVKDISEKNRDITLKTDDGLILIVSIAHSEDNDSFSPSCSLKVSDRIDAGTEIWNIEECDIKKLTAAVIVTNSDLLPSFNIRYAAVKVKEQPVMTIDM